MMYPHTITVINFHNERGREKAYTHVLKGVHYQDTQGVKTGNTFHYTDSEGYVQIPHSIEGYLSPQEWLNSPDKDKYWTIKENDLIVKGTALADNPRDTYGARSITKFENIDYGIIVKGHYGVYLK